MVAGTCYAEADSPLKVVLVDGATGREVRRYLLEGRHSHSSTFQLNLRRFCHSRRPAYRLTQSTRFETGWWLKKCLR
jgi:hypothetical protein